MTSATPPEGDGRHPLAGPPGSAQPGSHQYGAPASGSAQAPPGGPPPRPRGARPPLLPVAIGLVVGLVVGVFAGSFFADGSVDTDASGDAATSCRYVAALAEDFDPEAIGLEDPIVWRLQAAGSLAQAAAVADADYQGLGEQGMVLFAAVSRVEVDEIQAALQAMDEICQDL